MFVPVISLTFRESFGWDGVCLLLGADMSTLRSREQDDEVAESVRILKPTVLQRMG
jgi:hypothetical protein